MMKFLPVAMPTASMICVISASLKFGVMRCVLCCCASAIALTQMAASASPRRRRHEALGPVALWNVIRFLCVVSGGKLAILKAAPALVLALGIGVRAGPI